MKIIVMCCGMTRTTMDFSREFRCIFPIVSGGDKEGLAGARPCKEIVFPILLLTIFIVLTQIVNN
jgi:hypothetical protein